MDRWPTLGEIKNVLHLQKSVNLLPIYYDIYIYSCQGDNEYYCYITNEYLVKLIKEFILSDTKTSKPAQPVRQKKPNHTLYNNKKNKS